MKVFKVILHVTQVTCVHQRRVRPAILDQPGWPVASVSLYLYPSCIQFLQKFTFLIVAPLPVDIFAIFLKF
jgi:hypothetical protein